MGRCDMRRVQGFEFEDQAWFPAFLRNYMTDFLRYATYRLGLQHPICEIFAPFLKETQSTEIIDLCSGAGGLLADTQYALSVHMQKPLTVCFTDKYPNHAALQALCAEAPENRRYCAFPIDATEVPADLTGARTLFSAFHHFRPEQAQHILRDALRSCAPIAVIEVSKRSVMGLIHMLLSPLAVWLYTPALKPFRWSRLFWTYLIPAVPFFILWDGVISALRTYSPAELKALIQPLETYAYGWKVGRAKWSFGYEITYLLGSPAATPDP